MLHPPFYDPQKTYEENYEQGPFAEFSNGVAYPDAGDPAYEFLGQKVYLPFGIPAGPLLNGKFVNAALDKGFDIAVYKTVRTRSHPCSSWPNVVPLSVPEKLTLEMQDQGLTRKADFTEPLTITNSFGVPSKEPDVWQPDMANSVQHAKQGQVVIGSFQGTTSQDSNVQKYIDDFVLAARLVKETGAKILEANLSCPNEGTAHLLCFDLERTKVIAEAIKNEIGNTPLIIKIAYFRDDSQLKQLVQNIGNVVQGIATINTMPAKIYDEQGNQALPGENRLVSGTCGFGIKWAGLDMVNRLKALRQELQLQYSILGTGGVMVPADYDEYRNIGADAVMTATGAMWNPMLAQDIKENIKK